MKHVEKHIRNRSMCRHGQCLGSKCSNSLIWLGRWAARACYRQPQHTHMPFLLDMCTNETGGIPCTCQNVTLASSQATLHLDELASWFLSAHMLPPSSFLLIPTDDCANCPCECGMCSTVQLAFTSCFQRRGNSEHRFRRTGRLD